MDRQALLRKLEAELDEAARTHLFGSIEIEIRDGVPKFICKTNKELLTEVELRARNNR